MNYKQIFGILLLVGGIAAVIYGLSIQNSVEYKFVSAFGGDTSRVAMLMVGGIISAIAGLLLLIFGGEKTSTTNTVSQSKMRKSPNDQTDIPRLDDRKLVEIAENSGFYRPEVVEASRRELLIRRKCNELVPQMQAKNDEELREIVTNPELYTEELIRAAWNVREERRRLWQEEQERAEQAARIEREKKAEEDRQYRIAKWKKRRPYVVALTAVLAIGIGAGIYVYYRHNVRAEQLRQQAVLLEWQRQAEEKKQAEFQRQEAARRAEEQRLAEEKRKQQEQAERQRQAEAQAQADRERRTAGYFRIGELYEKNGVRGIVFHTDETGQHGKILSLEQERLSYSAASRHKGSLPSREEMDAIRENKRLVNKGLKNAGAVPITEGHGGYWLNGYDRGIVWYYIFDPGSSDDGKVSNCSETDVRSQPYIKQARWVYEY